MYSSYTIQTIAGGYKRVYNFPKGISPKVNVITWPGFELTFYDVAVKYIRLLHHVDAHNFDCIFFTTLQIGSSSTGKKIYTLSSCSWKVNQSHVSWLKATEIRLSKTHNNKLK